MKVNPKPNSRMMKLLVSSPVVVPKAPLIPLIPIPVPLLSVGISSIATILIIPHNPQKEMWLIAYPTNTI